MTTTKTINFHGEEAKVIADALARKDAEIESLRQQLADEQSACRLGHNLFATQLLRADRLQVQLSDSQKREVMLRDLLNKVSYVEPSYLVSKIQDALAATADLDGLILCHAEPSLCFYPPTGKTLHASRIEESMKGTWEPLYRAWEKK